MTYNQFRIKAEKLLENSGIDDIKSEIVQLVCGVCGMTQAEYLAKKGEDIPEECKSELEQKLERRLLGEPIQYILGEWEFYGLRMLCGKGCLIPRWETEMLVQSAVSLIPHNGNVLDLCTGSGCISVAILKNRPDVTVTAVDISPEALEYARRNAELHGVSDRLTLVCGDVADFAVKGRVDVIVSNPPYVRTEDVDAFDRTMRFEPRIAFDGGKDGLDFYRTIVSRFTPILEKGGVMLFEAGFDTTESVAQLMKNAGLETVMDFDVNGIPRTCMGIK